MVNKPTHVEHHKISGAATSLIKLDASLMRHNQTNRSHQTATDTLNRSGLVSLQNVGFCSPTLATGAGGSEAVTAGPPDETCAGSCAAGGTDSSWTSTAARSTPNSLQRHKHAHDAAQHKRSHSHRMREAQDGAICSRSTHRATSARLIWKGDEARHLLYASSSLHQMLCIATQAHARNEHARTQAPREC